MAFQMAFEKRAGMMRFERAASQSHLDGTTRQVADGLEGGVREARGVMLFSCSGRARGRCHRDVREEPAEPAPPSAAGLLVAHEGFADADDDVAIDELFLTACGLAQGGGGEAVDFA